MKKLLALCIVVGFPLAYYCRGEPVSGPLTVQIEDAKVGSSAVLSCIWTLHNSGLENLYVYASFLDKLSSDMVENNRTGGLLLRTTWIDVIQGDPIYYFPPARFVEIKPGGTVSGELKVRMAAHRRRAQSVRMVVGYGTAIDRVQKDIAQSLQEGLEFQGNPVTRWQTLAYSQAIRLHY
jgi:hypothetical protein